MIDRPDSSIARIVLLAIDLLREERGDHGLMELLAVALETKGFPEISEHRAIDRDTGGDVLMRNALVYSCYTRR